MLDKRRLGTFVLGGVAGALAGILFAPKSGRELRGSIASRAGEARERGRETYFEAQERMQERVSRVRARPTFSEEADISLTADSLPTSGADTPDPVLDVGQPLEEAAEPSPDPPPLRDVSRDVPPPPASGGEQDPEKLRRRIQETRSRLRARLNAPEPEEQDE